MSGHDASASTVAPTGTTGVQVPTLTKVALSVLAIFILGAVLFAAGGADYVMSLLGATSTSQPGGTEPSGSQSAPVAAVPTSPAESLELPAGVTEDLAKRMYVEQIQSQVNLEKMADGRISRFDVTSVKMSDAKDAAAVFVAAFFNDGTSGPGVIQLVKPADAWYFMSFTGLSGPDASGDAETVNEGTVAQGEQTDAEVVDSSGIVTFDEGVINTLLTQQTENQTLISGIVDGSYTKIVLGEPAKSAGTIVVPVDLSGKSADALKGEAVIIDSNDQDEHLFLTSFRAN